MEILSACSLRSLAHISGWSKGGGGRNRRAPPKIGSTFWYPIFIRMLKNKAQIAWESIKTTLELPGPWPPAESEFGSALVMCVLAHNPPTPPPPPGGWGTSIYMHIGYVPRERPQFSALNFRSGAYHFQKLPKKSVPEHHHFTFLGGFCRSGDHHFQNFFNFNPFIACHSRLSPAAKLFIPPQFRTPVRTHLHTANQRPRVLICIQPIHRGWFNPRYKLVRTTLLLSTARGVVVKATCIALHYTACSRGVSSIPLAGFFFCSNKMGNNGVYSVRGDTQMMK